MRNQESGVDMHAAELSGKAAVVTGGSRGIGYAIARALAELGAGVVISARQEESLQQARHRLAAEPGLAGARVEAIAADVTSYADVEGLMDTASERLGGLDILVNNAGIGSFGEVASQSIDDWHQTIATNLTGVFYCCRAAIPHLRRRGGGWIINISSLAGKNPFAGAAAYCASKAGLNAFSEALMQEVRYDDIRVSYVMPGSVRTDFGGHHDGAGTEWKLDPAW